MKKEGKIDYTLTINEPEQGQYGIAYQSDLQGEIAALLIVGNVLESKVEALKEAKKAAKSAKEKKDIGSSLAIMSKGLSAVNTLGNSLCINYEQFLEYWEKEMQKRQASESITQP